MTISAARNSTKGRRRRGRCRGGFSLLEIMIALSLVALIVSIGTISYASGRDERLLRETAIRIEAMSSRGHAMSILHQKPFWLRLEEGMIVLAGADVNPPPVEDEDRLEAWEEETLSSEVIYEDYVPDGSIAVSLRRWGAAPKDWSQPSEEETVEWQFQSTGLCEPVAIRIESGESYIVLYMHPLTARVEEEEMLIK